MLKRKGTILVLGVVCFSLVGCTPKETTNKTKERQTEVSQEMTDQSDRKSDQKNDKATILTGVLKEDASVEGDSVRLVLVTVEGVKDPENLAAGFGDEGVVLNASQNQLLDQLTPAKLLKGTQVEVALEEHAVTTRSLPPQIPGNSIISIKKLAE